MDFLSLLVGLISGSALTVSFLLIVEDSQTGKHRKRVTDYDNRW